jgi:hypothetical protein
MQTPSMFHQQFAQSGPGDNPRPAHHLFHEPPAEANLTPEEREALRQREYDAFRRENPGKAHFTREQWEHVRRLAESYEG